MTRKHRQKGVRKIGNSEEEEEREGEERGRTEMGVCFPVRLHWSLSSIRV